MRGIQFDPMSVRHAVLAYCLLHFAYIYIGQEIPDWMRLHWSEPPLSIGISYPPGISYCKVMVVSLNLFLLYLQLIEYYYLKYKYNPETQSDSVHLYIIGRKLKINT